MRRFMLAASALVLGFGVPALAAEAPVDAFVPPLPAGQLTAAARPTAYALDLTVDPARDRFSGDVTIDAVLAAPAAFIDLHGRDLAMRSVEAEVAGKRIAGVWRQGDSTGVARITFPETLPAGALKLRFTYDAAFNDNPSGMFRVKVGDDWYSWTQFESIDARAAFPSFDQPGFKVPFTVTLRTRPGQLAVSNAPEVSKTLEGGLEVHRFAPTAPLPTYLVAMMTGPFVTAEGVVPPTRQRAKPLPLRIVSTRPNAGKLGFALENSKQIVSLLEAYFDQPFPYPKLDQITSPIMPGAMENAGADLYADPILIMDEAASPDQKRVFGMVVAHELSHQWFGDLVTPAWWDDIWLNESFANWMGFKIGGEWRPKLNIAAGGLVEGFDAMRTDALVAGRPIRQPITTNSQIDEAFDTITYGKGGHVVAMVANFVGPIKFRAGVRSYMRQHAYGNATSTDFFAAIAESAGDTRLTRAMQGFTDQQGVPLITLTPAADGKWTITQSRYALLGATPPATRWDVPVCLRRDAARACTLLDTASATLAVPGKGVLVPNVEGTGYYRFELPPAQWRELIAAAPKLPGIEAVAVQDSLMGSFYAGRADPTLVIDAARAFARNPDSQAASRAFDLLEALRHRRVIADGPGALGLERLVRQVYAPQLHAMGLDLRRGAYAKADPEITTLRAAALAKLSDLGGDAALNTRLAQAAKQFLAGNTRALDQAFYLPAFVAYARSAPSTAVPQLVDKALGSEDAGLRNSLIAAAGSSGNAAMVTWLLNDLKDARLRPVEKISLLANAIDTPETRDLAADWLSAHLDELSAGNGGVFVASRLPGMFGTFCSGQRADQLSALEPRFAGKVGALTFQRTLERVRHCATLRQARGADLNAALAAVR